MEAESLLPEHWALNPRSPRATAFTVCADVEETNYVVVFDVDGVVSDASARQRFLTGDRPDWRAFFDACGEDPPVPEATALMEMLGESCPVVLLTARPLRVRPQTLAWLDAHGFNWDVLIMRSRVAGGGASHFKESEALRLRSYGMEPRLVLDDDPDNCEMFRRLNMPCLYVHSGYYAK